MSDPTIERITRHPGKRTCVTVLLSDGDALVLQDEVAYRYGLMRGRMVDQETRTQLLDQHLGIELRLAAERLLSRRPWSRKELLARLQKRSAVEGLAEKVVEGLTSSGILNDERFARAWIADRLRFRPASRSILLRDLRARGVDPDLASAVLRECLSSEDESSAAVDLAIKYRNSHPRLQKVILARRCAGYLQRRGYAWPDVREALRLAGLDHRDGDELEREME